MEKVKRLVVTGAKGGAGLGIVKVLRAAGYDVLGLDVKPAETGDTAYEQADVLDLAKLGRLLAGADGVIHFGSYPTDHDIPWPEAFENLTVGGFNLLEASAKAGIKRLVIASSMTVYGNLFEQSRLPVTEQSPLAPSSIYGASKKLIETLASDYCRWRGMSVAAFRLGRIVYEGCFDWRLQKHTESDESAANVLWCYVDARDVGTACQLWMESDRQGFMAFNVAAEDVCVETPTRALLKRFYPKTPYPSDAFDDHQTPYDAGLLRRTLGWRTRHSWRAIRDEWERANKK